MSVLQIVQLIQSLTIAGFVSIVLAGALSALVMVGLFDIGPRAALQRFAFTGRNIGEKQLNKLISSLATALNIAPDSILRLHYRQMSAQMVAVVSSTLTNASSIPTDKGSQKFLDDLLKLRYPEVVPPLERQRETDVNASLLLIDHVQMQMGLAISRFVFWSIFIFWTFVLVLVIWISSLAEIRISGGIITILASTVGAVIAMIVSLLIVLIVGMGIATVGSFLFMQLDRYVAAK